MLRNLTKELINLSVVLLSGVAIYFGVNLLQPSSPEAVASVETAAVAVPVGVETVAYLQEITIERDFPGLVEARQTSRIGFEFGGLLRYIDVDEGGRVRAGQRLAGLDTDILKAERNALISAQDALNVQYDLALLDFDRFEQLKRSGTVSVRELDAARAKRDELLAGQNEIKAQLAQLDLRIEKSTLRAPYDGTVGARRADLGDTVGAGEPVLQIFETGNALFRVGLPPNVDPNRLRNAKVEIAGTVLDATLRSVRPDIDPSTRSRTVLFDLVNASATSFGQQGTLRTQISQPMDGVWVPMDAMRASVGDMWTVFIVNGVNRVERVAVEVLHIGKDRAFVSGALEEGDQMIVAGAHKVTLGQLVEIVR